MIEATRHYCEIFGHEAIEVTDKEADVIASHKGYLITRNDKKYTTLDCGHCPDSSMCDQVKYDCPKISFRKQLADENIFKIDLFIKATAEMRKE